MPRPSHSTAARSGYVDEPDLSAIDSSRARTEQRRTAANTPYLPERYKVAVPCPGPCACYVAPSSRTHGLGCHEHNEDPRYSPYDRDVMRHISHSFGKPKPEFDPHHQHSELDPPEFSRRGRPYHRPSSYDAAGEELEFDRHGRFGHYTLPRLDSANGDSCSDDDVHGDYPRYESPSESPSLLSIFGASVDPPSPVLRAQNCENRGTNLDRATRFIPLERGSMGASPGIYPDYAGFLPAEDHDSRRAGVRPAGRHLTRHRFYDDSEADDLGDNLSEAFIHRPRLARPRWHHSDSEVESIDTDSQEEYSRQIRDFDFVDDAIADSYTGRFRAPTAAEKTHRRFLVSLSEDFARENLRAEAELRRQKRHDTHVAQSDTEDDSTPERVARQVRNIHSLGIRRAVADFMTGNRKPSPRGRRNGQRSESESITPQLQNTHPQVRHRVTAHPTTNRNPSSHRTHKNSSQPRRAPDRQTKPQKTRPNGNTARSKGQAPPSYDSVTPAQVTDSVQPDPVSNTPSSLLATATTETTTPNTTKASPLNHAQNPATPESNNNQTLRITAGPTQISNKLDGAFPPPAVQTPPCNRLHTSPAELGTNDHSDSSDSGAATPMTSSDNDNDDDENRLESASDSLTEILHNVLG